jgi:hypothetical protein
MRPGFSWIDRGPANQPPVNQPWARRTTPSERGIYEGRAIGVKVSYGPFEIWKRHLFADIASFIPVSGYRPALRADAVLLWRIRVIWVVESSPSRKNNPIPFRPKSLHLPALSRPTGGAARDRHGRGTGMRWTRAAPRTKAFRLRTAKPCGPDAPTLASSFAG